MDEGDLVVILYTAITSVYMSDDVITKYVSGKLLQTQNVCGSVGMSSPLFPYLTDKKLTWVVVEVMAILFKRDNRDEALKQPVHSSK